MRNFTFFAALFLSAIGFFLISSCEGCQKTLVTWLDEATITVPKEDPTPPKIWFEVIDAKTGTVQTITTDTELTSSNGDFLKINLWGEDADGGIKKLCLGYGFRKECCFTDYPVCSRTQSLGLEQCQDFSDKDIAFKRWFILSEQQVDATCQEGAELQYVSYSFVGSVENFHGGQKGLTLVIKAP